MKKIMSLSSGPPADETPQTSILTRMTKTVKYHIRQSFPYSVALFIVNGSPADIHIEPKLSLQSLSALVHEL